MARDGLKNCMTFLISPWPVCVRRIFPPTNIFDILRGIGLSMAAFNAPIEYDGKHSLDVVGKTSSVFFGFVSDADH